MLNGNAGCILCGNKCDPVENKGTNVQDLFSTLSVTASPPGSSQMYIFFSSKLNNPKQLVSVVLSRCLLSTRKPCTVAIFSCALIHILYSL